MAETKAYEGKASMLIRKPAHEVFEAIVNPAVTTRFWFTKSSGRLEQGQRVTWQWEMYGVSAEVNVLAIEPDRRVLVDWGRGRVEWTLEPRKHGTYVTVTESGFQGSADEIVRQALDSTGGFTWHLAGMKALLEKGLELGLTGDAHPRE